MLKRLFGTLYILYAFFVSAQAQVAVAQPEDSARNRSVVFRWYPAHRNDSKGKLILRNEQAGFGRKLLRGSGLVFAFEGASVGLLFALPESISKWDRNNIPYAANMKNAFTRPPVIDKDKWYINYLGHPYQGAYTYNAMRSQGAKVWQSSLFCLGHTLLWEYVIEAGLEQPSVQDMVVTPAAGILLGELFHFATIKMSNNGFRWYEAVFVSVFNPMYAINNGFKSARPLKKVNY